MRLLVALVPLFLLLFSTGSSAQVARGLLDPNVATEQELLTVPNLTPALVKSLMQQRPFANVVELNKFLSGQSLTATQLADVYGKAFIHINLNTASADEILLIPRAGKRMAHEFEEYRPWRSFAQFDKEIGKYVDANEVARLRSYVVLK